MSYRIGYRHFAVRYPQEELNLACPDRTVYQDLYLLLELGGDNNLTTFHPSTGREVGKRSWSVTGFGKAYEVMQKAVHVSAWCESECLRLHGTRATSPESYIKRMRAALAKPTHYGELQRHGFVLTAHVEDKRPVQDWTWQRKALTLHAPPSVRDEARCWSLDLCRIGEAALFMAAGGIDSREPWNVIRSDGPCFACESPSFFKEVGHGR